MAAAVVERSNSARWPQQYATGSSGFKAAGFVAKGTDRSSGIDVTAAAGGHASSSDDHGGGVRFDLVLGQDVQVEGGEGGAALGQVSACKAVAATYKHECMVSSSSIPSSIRA